MTAIPKKDGRYKLSNVEILKQENTTTNTTLDGDAVSAYKVKYAMKYQNKDMKYVWWHSHHTMDAFWSGTDTNEIGEWKNSSFSLALVINLRQEYKFRVSVWNACGLPVEQHYDISLTVERKNGVKTTDKMKTLYEELCDSPTYGSNVRQTGFNYNNHLARTNNAHLEMENAFNETVERLDEINDKFMEAGMSVSEWRKEIKKMNQILKSKKYPFFINFADEIKGHKQEVIDKIMVTLSGDMIKWEDEAIKNQVEQSYIWGGTYGY